MQIYVDAWNIRVRGRWKKESRVRLAPSESHKEVKTKNKNNNAGSFDEGNDALERKGN